MLSQPFSTNSLFHPTQYKTVFFGTNRQSIEVGPFLATVGSWKKKENFHGTGIPLR